MRKGSDAIHARIIHGSDDIVGLQSNACRDNYASNIDHRRR